MLPVSPSQSLDPALQNQLDQIIKGHKDPQGSNEVQSNVGITKRHWKPSNSRTNCGNSDCNKKFTFTDRHHHCRRCGDLYCKECVQYQRRLNNLANVDPQGKLYNVCQACFDNGPQLIGQTRNLGNLFKALKTSHQLLQNVYDERGHHLPRENFSIKQEMARLQDGFKNSIGNSSVQKTLHDIKSLMKTPDWMRARRYQATKLSEKCFYCKSEFGIFKKSYDCSVCGEMCCSNCTSLDLLIYLDDVEKTDPAAEPHLAIIRIVGCPEKEPDISLYLRVCISCRATILKNQVEGYQNQQRMLSHDNNWFDINATYESISGRKQKIEQFLPKYQALVSSLEDGQLVPKVEGDNRSVIQKLAKAQEDLSDLFTQLILASHELKRLKPVTESQKTVIKNMTLDVVKFYQENMHIFREQRSKMEAVTPLNVLECIQEIVEKNTINSAYVTIKQLGFETLSLCMKNNLDDAVPRNIAEVEQIMVTELERRIIKSHEDWDTHRSAINDFIKLQLAEHRIIRPSRRMSRACGSKYVEFYLLERSSVTVQKVVLQLSAKCLEKSFEVTKAALEKLNDFLSNLIEDK